MSTFEAEDQAVIAAEEQRKAREDAERRRAKFEAEGRLASKLVGKFPRDKLADVAIAAAGRIAADVLTGNVQIRHGTDAAAAIKALMEVGRMEKGEAVPGMEASPEEKRENIKQLQDQLAERRRDAERAPAAVPGA